MLLKIITKLFALCINVSDGCFTESVPLMDAVSSVAVGADRVFRYLLW